MNSDTNISSWITFITIPSEYRPSVEYQFPCANPYSGGVVILTNGNVQLREATSSLRASGMYFIS